MPKFTSQEKILHDQFVQYGRNAKEWMHKCIMLLPHIEKHKIWQKKGFENIYEYAGKLAGLSRYKVNDALRILNKVEDKPELLKVIEQKGIFAVKPVVTIVTPETAGFWAEKAQMMTKNTLETYVKEFKGQNGLLEPNNKFGNHDGLLEPRTDDFGVPRKQQNGDMPQQQAISTFGPAMASTSEKTAIPHMQANIQPRKIVAMELEPEIIEQLEKLKGQGDWNDLMKQLLKERAANLEEQKPQAIKTKSRHIPNKTKKYITARTNGQCSFPKCIKPAEIAQHTQRWALENIHDPDRLYGLCKEHERIAHLGLIENEEQSPQNWKISAQPDINDPKYKIDLVVQKFRNKHHMAY